MRQSINSNPPILSNHVIKHHTAVGSGSFLERIGNHLLVDGCRVQLYQSLPRQRYGGGGIQGYELLEELKRLYIPLDATILECLLTHQELIPDGWGGAREVSFMGTIYVPENYQDSMVVRTVNKGLCRQDFTELTAGLARYFYSDSYVAVVGRE